MPRKVKNINGTSDTRCVCGSWLRHWENFSNQSAGMCSGVNCIDFSSEGAHVQKSYDTDKRWFIIPLCRFHNSMKGQEITIRDSVKLVLANKSETCEKQSQDDNFF